MLNDNRQITSVEELQNYSRKQESSLYMNVIWYVILLLLQLLIATNHYLTIFEAFFNSFYQIYTVIIEPISNFR